MVSYQVTQTLQWVVRSWTDLENSMVAVERVQDYARIPKEVKIGRWNEGPWFQGGACPPPFPQSNIPVGWSHSHCGSNSEELKPCLLALLGMSFI